jgi:glycerol-3-phosphate dehydrogenase (NAD(P)+)
MGSAMVFPLVDSGFEVNLWGTWLDDDLIDGARAGEHPRLKKSLPESVGLFKSTELAEAIDGADMIFIGVSSEGFVPVFEEALKVMQSPRPVFTLTKGFSILRGTPQRTSTAGTTLFKETFGNGPLHWTSIGGPVKAFELARAIPSPAIYGTASAQAVATGRSFQTDYYRVRTTTDVAGVELCSALKNVYAMGVGLCDGLFHERFPRNYHNLSSLLFNQSIREMAEVVAAEGGKTETAYDLAGVGDLYVTAQSGKNQYFGYLVGEGMAPEEAYQKMQSEGQLAEGYLALKAGRDWLSSNHPDIVSELPLFNTLSHIALENGPVESSLREMVVNHL